MSYNIRFTKNALKDYELIKQSPYKKSVKDLLYILKDNPYIPPYEALIGNMHGLYSRRISKKHRLVYEINEETKTIKIRAMWGHYDDN